jgi:hypothetical protein
VKRRFVRHVFRYWEIIRSRIPPQSASIIDALIAWGQLSIIAGRTRDLVETETGLEVRYTLRGSTTILAEASVRGHQLHRSGDVLRANRPPARQEPVAAALGPSRAGTPRYRRLTERRRHRYGRYRLGRPVHPRIDDEGSSVGGPGCARDLRSSRSTCAPPVGRRLAVDAECGLVMASPHGSPGRRWMIGFTFGTDASAQSRHAAG